MSAPLAYRIAKDRVENFGETEGLAKSHHEAMDCYNCEAFLQSGIDAFQWIQRADETIRRAIYEGALDSDSALGGAEGAIEALLRLWLAPCEFASAWIAENLERGYTINSLADFRRCEDEVRAIVHAFDDVGGETPQAIRVLRDKAIEDHRNGETAEFI
jgi:hypothetical protein